MLAAKETPRNRRWRERGFREAVQGYRLPFEPDSYVEPTDGGLEDAIIATHALLGRNPQITAIFAYNDIFAIGAIRACQEMGRQVPRDCAVVGFDDIAIASLVQPALTTIRIDKSALGAAATHQMLQILDKSDEVVAPVILDTELVVRESA